MTYRSEYVPRGNACRMKYISPQSKSLKKYFITSPCTAAGNPEIFSCARRESYTPCLFFSVFHYPRDCHKGSSSVSTERWGALSLQRLRGGSIIRHTHSYRNVRMQSSIFSYKANEYICSSGKIKIAWSCTMTIFQKSCQRNTIIQDLLY